jgi:uncharacterized protein (TIGR03435 family)
MNSSILCVSLLCCCAAFGQQANGKIAFEVASIKPPDASSPDQIRVGMSTDAGMLRYTNVSLKDCIRVAYRVKDFQVEGPDWIGNARFNIVAKLPAGSSEDQIPEMLQALLAERFKLTAHRDTKEHAIYAMVAAKGGPKLKPAEVPTGGGAVAGGNAGRGGIPRGAISMQVAPDGVHLKAASATLASLGEMLSRFSERPVVDMTGVEGQYDFELVFAPETMRGMPGGGRGPGPGAGGEGHSGADGAEGGAGSIYDSVQRYGLKLEPRKAPMPMVVVEHIEQTPTEN